MPGFAVAASFVAAPFARHCDTAAFLPMIPIIESAGGAITDWDGKRLRMVSDGRVVAATTSALNREVRLARENGHLSF